LDILQLRILTALGSWKFAKMVYLFGKNSPVQIDSENDPFRYYSVRQFAVSANRRNASPYFNSFVQYYDDPNYADTLILEALNGRGKWGGRTTAQKSAFITESCAFHVIYLHTLAQINGAVDACNGYEEDGEYELTHPWDEVAALVIGSLEGPAEGGSRDTDDGQLIWGLSNRRAFQFQKLNDDSYSEVASKMIDHLFAGKGELDALDCDNLRKTANKVVQEMLIPLLQSVLRYAIQNEKLDNTADVADLALGEVFSLALVPIVSTYDQNAADIIEENMVYRPGIDPVRDGVQSVANALGDAAENFGITCQRIGYTNAVDPCIKYGGSSAPGLKPTMMALLLSNVVVGGLLWLAIL
jgi:hypothetical protein